MPWTVLVADDDRDLLNLTALILRLAGYTVLLAADGAEALAVAERERPDLIVSDMLMSGLTGLELTAALRAWADHGPPVLLLGAGVVPSALPPRCAFLPKPFTIDHLERAVAALLPVARHRRR
jgi:CheY-like chemotaxis protein